MKDKNSSLDNSALEQKSLEEIKSSREKKRIRSYVLRQGRITSGQKKALEESWDQYALKIDDGMINPEKLFGRKAGLVLEIGFGNGDSLIKMMAEEPEKNYLGVEVHRPGVGSLIKKAAEQNLNNLKVYCEDAVTVLQECIPDGNLECVQIFFPDPWHKKKHHKRRLIQADFVQLLIKKIKTGGKIHLATDWENYAEQMMEVLSAEKKLSNQAGSGNYSPRPESRALTKFESRGQRLGHGVWDLIFIKE